MKFHDGHRSDAKSYLLDVANEAFPCCEVSIKLYETEGEWKAKIAEILTESREVPEYNLAFREPFEVMRVDKCSSKSRIAWRKASLTGTLLLYVSPFSGIFCRASSHCPFLGFKWTVQDDVEMDLLWTATKTKKWYLPTVKNQASIDKYYHQSSSVIQL